MCRSQKWSNDSSFGSDTNVLRLVGVLTPRDFDELICGDAELKEQFSIVYLSEPQSATATALVRHFAKGLEAQYRLRIDDEAIRRAVTLSDSYIMHERLPYKAVKVLQSICDDIEYDRTQRGLNREAVTDEDVVFKISQISGIPETTLAGVGESVDYQAALCDLIVGQDHVVREVAMELGLIKAGMTDRANPPRS